MPEPQEARRMMTKHRYPGLDLEQENGGMPERKDKPEIGEKKTLGKSSDESTPS